MSDAVPNVAGYRLKQKDKNIMAMIEAKQFKVVYICH